MEKRQRLVGIDLFRGLAIYSVVLIHTDEGIPVLPPVWSQIVTFAGFAVPFFLATAFYLASDKLYLSQSPYPLRSRLARLLIPYGCWSAFYLLYKIAKYAIASESSKLLELLHDPFSLLFFGGAAFHLYFLPLLATGTLLVKFSEFLIEKKVSLKALVIMSLASFLMYEMVLVSGNDYQNGSAIAFQALLAAVFPTGNSNPLLRWILVELAWILRCLPYVLVGMLLTHPDARKFCLKLTIGHPVVWLFIFFICNAFGFLILPQSLYEVARGYTALLSAIALSNSWKDDPLIKNLGLCSFGIYFVHLLFLETFQSLASRIYPNYIYHINTATLLIISIIILFSSWATTVLLMKSKNLSRFLFS